MPTYIEKRRSLVTERDIKSVSDGGSIVLPPGALITPLARQAAFKRRITLEESSHPLPDGGSISPGRRQQSTVASAPYREEAHLRDEIVRIGRMIYEKGFIVAGDGNISVRLGPDRVLATPSGRHKGFLRPDELVVTDLDGRLKKASAGLRPTSEMPMHLEVYRQRVDINAVLHTHLPIAVALSIAGIPLDKPFLPEAVVTLGPIPTTEYALPASQENVAAIRNLIGRHNAIVLRRHGALTAGTDLFDAYMRMEAVEHKAHVVMLLELLGRGEPLDPDQVSKLLALRQQFGLQLPE